MLAGNHGYEVRNNNFDKCSSCGNIYPLFNQNMGLVVKNAHSENEIVQLNTFANQYANLVALQENGLDDPLKSQGLIFKCNDFFDNQALTIARFSIDASISQPTSATLNNMQGTCASKDAPAGNRFFNTCYGYGNERLFADGLSSQQVTYNNNQAASVYDPVNTCITQPEFTNNPCFTGQVNHLDACPSVEEGIEALKYSEAKNRYNVAQPNTEEQSSALVELYLATSSVARYHAFNYNADSAATILAAEGRFGEAFAFYKDAGMMTEAANAILQMPENTDGETFYKQMCGWALADTSKWRSINTNVKDSLIIIATTNSFATYMAQAALGNYLLETINWPIAEEAGGAAAKTRGNNKNAANALNKNMEFGSVAPVLDQKGFSIYPNPTTSQFTVMSSGAGTLSITSMDGRKLAAFSITTGRNVGVMPANVPSGLYILHFQSSQGDASHIVKLIYQAK